MTGDVPNQFAQVPPLHAIVVVGGVTSELIVKDHDTSDASVTSFVSLTPPEPPETVAVYVTPGVSGDVGVSVALVVAESYVTVDGTTFPDPSRSWKLDVPTELELSISLNTAVTVVVRITPVAFGAGLFAVTVGGVLSATVSKTGSTQ